jgi:AcrR family transcriptional regulator
VAERLRADARRNRDLVLRAAADAFATDGLTVSVQEIARRAGVGTGTVSRHFPSKVDLYAAVLLDRMRALIERADAEVAELPAGDRFAAFFALLIHDVAAHQGLAEALAGAGYDVEAAGAAAGLDVSARLRDLLARAQRAGTVRRDLTYADVKALMTGCLASAGDRAGLDRVIAVVVAGIRP